MKNEAEQHQTIQERVNHHLIRLLEQQLELNTEMMPSEDFWNESALREISGNLQSTINEIVKDLDGHFRSKRKLKAVPKKGE